MVAVPRLHREVVHPWHYQQVAAAGGGSANDIEQGALGEVAIRDEQHVRADLTMAASRSASQPICGIDRLGDAVLAVVDEADHGQPVFGVVAEDLHELAARPPPPMRTVRCWVTRRCLPIEIKYSVNTRPTTTRLIAINALTRKA